MLVHRSLIVICLVCGIAQRPSEAIDIGSAESPDSVMVGLSEAVFDRIIRRAAEQGLNRQVFGAVIQWVGEQLRGAPYESGLLDRSETEELVINLVSFDCVLFVEAVLAMSQTIVLGQETLISYAAHLRSLRYRGGLIDGYCSRLHYFTDWIEENQERGAVHNVTADLEGVEEVKPLDFMTGHRSAYPRMDSDETFACIVEMERHIAGVPHVYVPQDEIEDIYPLLESGDIIAASTDIDGLDVTHTGFAHIGSNGRVGFLHASSTGQVKIAADLHDYIRQHGRQRGIVVVRPIDPRQAKH